MRVGVITIFSRFSKHERHTILIALFGIGFFIFFTYFQPVLSRYYDPRNHLSFHIILEFISIFISFMIFFYGLLLFRKSKNQLGLLFGIIFFSVGIFDIFHTMTYRNMPFFVIESSIAKATWFWIIGRLTESVLMLLVIAYGYHHFRHINLKAISISMIYYVFFASVGIFFFADKLPLLVIEGVGTTPLKNNLEYIVSFLHILVICIVFLHYRKERKPPDLYLILAFLFLILGELVFTTYQSVHDLNNFLGHFYKVCGYAFIFHGVLVPLLNEPFLIKEFAEGETIKLKKQMDFILHNMPDAVVIFNDKYEILYVNDGFEKIYGWKREEVINSNIFSNEFFLDEHEKMKSMDMFNRVFAGEPIQNHEMKRKSKSGTPFIVSITLFPNKNHLDQITTITAISRDITEKKRAEEALIKSEKLSVVGELAAGVAHEIRNPLTTIKGFMKLLEDKVDNSEKVYIQIMLDEVDRINLITNEFMTIAKPQVKEYKKESLSQIIEEVIQFYRPNLIMNNITLQKVNDIQLPQIVCEKHQIKQVFINLIKNAAEAMPKGGKITLNTTYDQENAWIQIKDEGCGIPKELMGRLGEPFYTLKEKGTGLGLMVCFRIIREHKGSIQIDSEVGVGTTIEIQLPLNLDESVNEETEKKAVLA